MKQSVIVFLDYPNEKAEADSGLPLPNSRLDSQIRENTTINELIGRCFPTERYDVSCLIYSRSRYHTYIDGIWKNIRSPILAGYGLGALYLTEVRNYSRKYLINPFYNKYLCENRFLDTDDYEKENTYLFFGSGIKDTEARLFYSQFYTNTQIVPNVERLSIEKGLEFILENGFLEREIN